MDGIKNKTQLQDGGSGRQYLDMLALALGILAVYLVIWSMTGYWIFRPSVYNSYVLQANRWLSGHLDLGQNYSYLEIAEYGGKFFVSFPPIPSVILLPFCALFGGKPPDTLIAVLIGIVGAAYALKMVWLTGRRGGPAIFWALFVTVGSNFLHVGFTADVWYIAQTCSFTFTMMALYYAMAGGVRSGWASCFFLALAFGCRPLQIVYLPIVIYLLCQNLRKDQVSWREAGKKYWWWVLPPLAVGVFLMALNYARFGNPFQFGHDFLPEFVEEKVNGQFSLSYLGENMKRLWELPKIKDNVVQFPLFNGCAFWIFSPIYLAFAAFFLKGAGRNVKKPELWLAVLLILLHFVLLCCHATMGGYQFGNRYVVDTLPVIFFALLVMLREEPSDLEFLTLPLFLWGLGVNLAGTIAWMNQWLR